MASLKLLVVWAAADTFTVLMFMHGELFGRLLSVFFDGALLVRTIRNR